VVWRLNVNTENLSPRKNDFAEGDCGFSVSYLPPEAVSGGQAESEKNKKTNPEKSCKSCLN
jgi:hypothetical protein